MSIGLFQTHSLVTNQLGRKAKSVPKGLDASPSVGMQVLPKSRKPPYLNPGCNTHQANPGGKDYTGKNAMNRLVMAR